MTERRSNPNILFIFTDQQSAGMMSCAGNRDLNTPALDSLAARGTRFERAYCAQPLCVPSRGAMFTGMYPHEFGVTMNDDPEDNSADASNWVAGRLREHGYHTSYIGKWHLPIAIADLNAHGFSEVIESLDPGIPGIFKASLQSEKPFFSVISLTNPHDICKTPFKRKKRLPNGELPAPPPPEECPELPANFDAFDDEPQVLKRVREKDPEGCPSADWTEDYWRVYRWAYARLTEKVDLIIGEILTVLRASGQEQNTIVLFSSDHGEGAGAHRWIKKNACYDESIRVPLIIVDPRRKPGGHVDRKRLVSTGLDLFPTLCDYAEVESPEDLKGRSLRPLCEGVNLPWRNDLVVETQFGPTLAGAMGRALYTDQYKYTLYSRGEHREILVDISADPGELNNLAGNPAYRDQLIRHRHLLLEWCRETNDAFKVPEAREAAEGVNTR